MIHRKRFSCQEDRWQMVRQVAFETRCRLIIIRHITLMTRSKGGFIVHTFIAAYLIIQAYSCNITTINGCKILDLNNSLSRGVMADCACLECEIQFAIDASNICSPCNATINNCNTCNSTPASTPVCTSCDSSYFLNISTNQCDLCSAACIAGTAIDNCTIIVNNTCTICSSLIPNCESCSLGSANSLICITCDATYILNNSTDQCEYCNKTCTVTFLNGCSATDVGNILNSCYSSFCGCLACMSTFGMLPNNTCVSCSSIIDNCNICTNITTTPTCQSCINSSYVLDTTKTACLFCDKTCINNTLVGCTRVDVNNTRGHCNQTNCSCLTCAIYFDMDATYNCRPCNLTIPYCINCINSATNQICNYCNYTYALNTTSNQCFSCPLKYTGCWACRQTTNHCLTCNGDRFFNWTSLQCQRCDTVMVSCSYCTVETICLGCYWGFGYLPNGTCAQCSLHNSNCALCKYTQNCTTCRNITNIVMYNRSLCGPCYKAMPFCATCTSNTTCQSCNSSFYGINYTASPTTCLLCNLTILNCLTCPNFTFCTGCISNFYALQYIDPDHQICSTCLSLLDGCSTCNNRTSCLTCITNGSYLYSPANLACVPCDFYLQFCATCLPTYVCLTCKDHRYAMTSSLVCQPCSYFINSCQYCDSNSECTLCLEGRLLLDKSGCTKVTGCIVINKQGSPSSNCIACEPSLFLPDPFNGKCICRKGWLVGSYCTMVIGCTRTSYNNIQVSCDACNIPQNFVWINGICECTEHYVLTGRYCSQICGDGFVINYQCDDGNTMNGDGCSSKCEVEVYHHCDNDNTRFPSSNCKFQAQVKLSLQSILKTIVPNEAKITFNMTPYSNKLQQMDLTGLVLLNASFCQITGIKISEGQLVITFKFNETIDKQPADFFIKFDSNYVRSPPYKLSFGMVQSTGVQLIYSSQSEFSLSYVKTLKVLAWLSLGMLFAGSFAFRMIGLEILYTIQITRLLQATSKYHTSFFANFQSLDNTYGQFPSLFGSGFSQTKFSNLGFSAGLSDNYFIFYLTNSVFFLLYGLVIIYRFKLKMGIKSKEVEQKILPPKVGRQNVIIQQKIGKVDRLLAGLYNWMLFPILMGFLMHFFHTVLVNESGNHYKQTPFSYFFSIFFTFIISAFTFHYELVNKDDSDGVLKQNCKNRYVPYFFIHHMSIFFLSTIILIQANYLLYYAVMVLVSFHTLYIVIRRPYSHPLSNLSIFFNQLFLIFGLFWVMIKNTPIDNRQNTSFFILSFIIGGFLVNLFGIIRTFLLLKERYLPSLIVQLRQGNHLASNNNELKQNLKQIQQLDFTRLKMATQYDKMYSNMLDCPKIIHHSQIPEHGRAKYNQPLPKSIKKKQLRKHRYMASQLYEKS